MSRPSARPTGSTGRWSTQFFDWVGRAAIGDLGESFFFKPASPTLIGERMPITLTLGLTGLVIALLVSLPLGILAAVQREHRARPRWCRSSP